MNNMGEKKNTNAGGTALKAVLSVFPFVLIFAAFCLLGTWAYDYFAVNTPLRLVIGSDTADTELKVPDAVVIVPPEIVDDVPVTPDIPETPEPDVSEAVPAAVTSKPSDSFPVIYYGEQWATLNLDGWEKRDIPVYFGDEKKMLSRGAGMSLASRFCGKGSRTVLSAHVTSFFYEMEDSAVGDTVYVDTVYGHYEYTVKEIRIFKYTDDSIFFEENETETLVLYTCYPRENGYAFKSERLALICELSKGVQYID